MSSRRVKLLTQLRRALRVRGYSRRTEQAYLSWVRRFILFHSKRHPAGMGGEEVAQFLTYLAEKRRVSPSTQSQAASALIFLYKKVLGVELSWIENVVRAQKPLRVPVVLTKEEVAAVLEHLEGTKWLVVKLMHGSGLRLQECLELRVKDIDFGRGEIRLRNGKGGKDRVTMLPRSATDALIPHLKEVRRVHRRDLAGGAGYVQLPHALERKYLSASREWPWQYVFPASRPWADPETGRRYRHHLHPSAVQHAVKSAVRKAGITKHRPATPSAIPSQRTSSSGARTSARSRSSWATKT